ncbi:MAG: TonB-linked SusC/RagA family outer membrane protein [Granulosicoccus sp.]|jgi:TonB-linked SusC/RagA family outer membrane protein
MKLLRLTHLFCFMAITFGLQAQLTVRGTVTDDSGETLIGVNILEKGTVAGTSTDVDGTYIIDVSDGNVTLVFSYTGFATIEVLVAGQSTLDVKMEQGSESLDEIVVTALGFKENRDKISSTYSKINGEKVVQRGENKVVDGIAGKTSGVRISGTSGDPGAGANIQIRGQNTITGTSQPLIIVDGVPISNDYLRGSGSDSDAGVSQQSRLNDINPEDIESFQIYKGASAAALYGSRAMNGAIVITTKRGKKGKMQVTYTTGFSFDQISIKHPLQTTFGQGTNGNYSATSAFSWGDKISDRAGGADVVNNTGQFFESLVSDNIIYPTDTKNSQEAYTDRNFDQVFRNAVSFDNKISISGGNDRTTYYISGAYVNQEGIIRGSDYKKGNITASFTQRITDKFKADFKVNYINSSSNRTQQGSNTAGVYLGLLRNAPDFDITDYKGNYHSSSGAVTQSRQRSYRRYLGNTDNPIYNNPLWTINEQLSSADVNRFIGSTELSYTFNPHITLVARGGADVYNDTRLYFFPYYTAGADRRYGLLQDETYQNQEYNLDLLANFNYDLADKIGSNIVVGFGVNDRNRKRTFIEADNFIANFRGLYDPTEVSKKENISGEVGRTLRRNIRFYGTGTFDYDEQVFLTLGGAYEKHSSLNDPFFYPSVELGWNFTKSFEKPDWFTFGKLRLAFGQVGNVPLPHREESVFEVGSFSTFSDNITLEDFGGGYQVDERLGNNNLQPEIKTEYEYGVDLRFFRNRVSLSATYYTNEIKDALLDIALSPSLGFDEIYGNGANIENKGFELELNYDFIKREDWRGSVFTNFSRNRNLVTKIQGGGVVNLAPGSSVQSVAIEGHPIGVFYTQDALRDASGNLVLNEDGFPQVDLSGNFVVGDPNPDWRGGLGFNFGYKKFNASILFETAQGNDFSERTRFITSYFGTHADVANEITLTSDLKNYGGDIVSAGTTVRGNIGNFGEGDVLLDESYYTSVYGFGDGKLNSFTVSDGSWTRIREASISYVLDGEKLRNAIGFQSIEIGISGRNLKIWSDVVGIDPDVNQFGVGQGQGIDYFTNPGTRTYIFSLRATF